MENHMFPVFKGSSPFRLPGALLVAMSLACCVAPAAGQEDATAGLSDSPTATNQAAGSVVPRLIKFTGAVKDATGKLQSGGATLTFSLYEEQESGAPLWVETQSVQLDEQGRYIVLLGATQPEGLPLDLFSSGKARWLGVTPQLPGVGEQPRALLVGVPYALKAADAETLGGKPVSAFVTTESQTSPAQAGPGVAMTTRAPNTSAKPTQGVPRDSAAGSTAQSTANVVGTGTTNHIPRWTNSTTLGNSLLFQTGAGNVGLATTTPTQKFEVDSGNLLVRGPQNFSGAGTKAFLYVGDTNHPIEAISNSGLAVGTYKVPEALFIQDRTGNVGIGTTTPKDAILSTVANSSSVVGLSAVGWTPPFGSSANPTDAIHATGGGNITLGTVTGGNGMVAVGGSAVVGGEGIVATGGSGHSGGAGLLAYGGGGTFGNGGVVAHGGSGGASPGDGIDAFGGTGGPPPGNGLAGSFTGDVSVSGNLTVSGTKHFRIDHPLDPANKYLYHAALESSEVLNLYTGNVVLDINGEAAVQLPDWLEALNRDFRYQLTAIGAPAPNLHIAQKIQNNSFKIAGGSAGLEVSWQVTGVRQDAWEKLHPMTVEVPKPPRERGYYINPELFGAPPERGIEWARNPPLMKRMKDIQEKQQDRQSMLAKPGK